MDPNHSDLPFPVASIEFEKVYMVMDRRVALGWSDRELSFLLGYRALYVRDVENPLHTLRYTPKDTNYLLSIFDCKLPDVMQPKVSELFYQVKVVVDEYADGGICYEIFRELGNKKFVLYRTLVVGKDLLPVQTDFDELQIHSFVDHLFGSGYFSQQRTALEVFKKCIGKFGKVVPPGLVLAAISVYTGKRKSPKLTQAKNESGRTVYKRG